MKRALHGVLSIALFLLAPASARAQDTPGQATEKKEERPNGLPSGVTWTFNFDAGWGSFGFANSLYQNPKEGVKEDLSDQWFEGFVKPALSAAYTFASSSELYGKVSAVGERTYGEVPEAYGPDVSSFGPEDLSIGWRSGKSIGKSENVLDFVVGRTQYRLGHGFLVYDGAGEGGSRGGYWTNARKAFEFAAIGRVKPGPHTIEMFYLDKDELDEGESGSKLSGINYEITAGKDQTTTIGATYMKGMADPKVRPGRDGLDVFNVRAYTAPIPAAPDLSFEFEYAAERNGEALDSNAWTAQGAYELSNVAWKPKITYRYAFFQGDDPATATNEAFDALFLGFYDWGYWWQGEIAGEYFLSNSNLKSHMVRAHFSPTEKLGAGLLLFKFGLDQPGAVGRRVTSTDVAFETDAYADWKVNGNITISLVGAYANPGPAVEQATGRTKNFSYGMVYVAYSF